MVSQDTSSKIKERYKHLNIDYFKQLWEYASILDYGTDVDMGGGEYCQAVDKGDKLKSKKYVIKMYDKLKEYEADIKSDAQYLESKRLLPDDDLYFVITLWDICKRYHKEIEQIRDIIAPIQTEAPEEQQDESAKEETTDKENRQNEPDDNMTTKFDFEQNKQDTYKMIYDCLTTYNVLEKEEFKTFVYNLKHGDLSAEYKDKSKTYLRKLCAMIIPHIKDNDDKRKWKHKMAVSLGLKKW